MIELKKWNFFQRFLFHWSQTKGFRRLFKLINALYLQFYVFFEKRRMAISPQHLSHFENKVFSQNGEDGIITEIFKRIGLTNKTFVEFGIEDGTENNCRHLLENEGWNGLWIEGSPENATKAQEKFSQFPIQIFNEFITKDNIVDLFKKANIPEELDFLTVDIDGNDYWVWEKILEAFRPRACSIEYNASLGAERSWVMPYNPEHWFQGTRSYGASLKAYNELAEKNNYVLVGCDKKGVNAFFIRKDCLTEEFVEPGNVNFHYMAPKYHGYCFGHPNL